ncbi:MAG: hypothetical protein Tsb0014_16160 [Pleurocapsa sp.]
MTFEHPNYVSSQNNNGGNSRSPDAVTYRLLAATNEIATVLLGNEDLDRGVESALGILGESINADRLNVHKHYDDSTGATIGYVICQYEWISDGTKSQIAHPKLHRIPYDGVEDCYDLFCAGQHWGGLIETLGEPFRSGQIELGVKATYAIPIMLKDRYWGIVALDFCQVARLLEDSEIAVLKTAATCIGSAITREQIQREQEQARCEIALAQQKTAILEERDRILKITTDVAQVLLNDESLDRAIATALEIIGMGIKSDRVAVMEHHEDATGASLGYVEMLYEWHSAEAVAQLHHPNLHRVTYEGIEDWYQQFVRGEAIGGIVEEFPEPVKSGQMEIGVKSSYAVPIMVNAQYWGLVALDDCKTAIQRSETEIALLKTTAVCIGSAIEQYRIRQQQEQIQRNIFLEQQKAAQLAEHNKVLEKRDRLLEATASAANIISTEQDFDLAVNQALQIIGEAIDTDRVAVLEQYDDPSGESLGYAKMLYEWHSIHTIAQLNHPEADRVSYEGIEKWYELLCQGNWTGGIVEELPEPFRSFIEQVGAKSTYTIPIMVEGKYWGVVGIDNCRQATRLSEAEISVLKTAAASIGGAIEKERSRQAEERATRENAAQLAEHNKVLQQRDRLLEATASAANIISIAQDFDLAVKEALKVIGKSINADRVSVMEQHNDSSGESVGYVKMLYEWHSIYTISQLNHDEADIVSWAGIEDWYESMCRGEWAGGIVEELGEPFCSIQQTIEVKSTYAIPIMVDGKYWGIVGLDHSRQGILLNEAEISVLKTAAAFIGGAIEKERSREAYQQAIQERADQLTQQNRILQQRDRLLEVTASAANIISTAENFNLAVEKAVQIIGESIDTDRITVMEHFSDLSGKSLGYAKMLYEWHSIHTVPQLNHSQADRISYIGVEYWYEHLCQGNWTGGIVEELGEPFRSIHQELGVKSSYAIPIMVEGKYWGIVGLDHCRQAILLNEAEISVLKTAAAFIGGAIEKERSREAYQQAIQERAAQLEASNRVLSLRDKWLEATAKAANELLLINKLDEGIDAALKVLGEGLNCDRVLICQHIDDPTREPYEFVRFLYEWNSPNVIPQVSHPELNEISVLGIEEWFAALKAGNWIGGVIEELQEPFKSSQQELGVEATYSVPIFVNNLYWGAIAIDFCHEPRRLTEAEIAVFKTTASCVGSAIAREQQDKAFRESEQRYRTLFELSNEGIYRFEMNPPLPLSLSAEEKLEWGYQHLRFVEVNKSMLRQYGMSEPEELVGKRIKDIHPEGSVLNMELESNRKTLAKGRGLQNIETTAININGKPRYFIINETSEVRNGFVYGGWGTKTDVTELKKAQQNLLEVERQRADQLEQSNRVLSLRDSWLEATAKAANELLLINQLDEGINAALKVLGEGLNCDRVQIYQHFEGSTREQDESLRLLYEWNSPNVIPQIYHPEFNKIFATGLENCFARMKAGDCLGGTIEELQEPFRSSQIELGVEATYVVPIFVNNTYWGNVGIDFCHEPRRLTEPEIAVFKTTASCVGSAIYRQQIQQEKEQAELAILDERNRMAREIHDTLAQAFTGISLQLEAARNNLLNNPEEVQERLNLAKILAKEGITEARRSVRALRPEALESGLAIALKQLGEKMFTGTEIQAQITIEGEIRPLDPEIEVNLFRIAQEAITNTLRHANASEIAIELIYEADSIHLQIKDNGVGFEPKVTMGRGFGLIGIKERCDRINCNLVLNSASDRGTEIIITVTD